MSAALTTLPVTSPSIASSVMPLRPAFDDLALGDMHRAALGEMHKAAPLGKRDAAAVENKAGDGDMVAAAADSNDGPPAMTMRVAPGVPEIAA